jgi:hypothetical protein
MQFIASYNDFYLDVYSYDLKGYLKPNVYIDMNFFFWEYVIFLCMLYMWGAAVVFLTDLIVTEIVFCMLVYQAKMLVMGLIELYACKLASLNWACCCGILFLSFLSCQSSNMYVPTNKS